MLKPGEKKCPRCAETIKAEATVCRFCGHQFAPEEVAAQVVAAKPSKTKGAFGCLLLAAIGVLAVSMCGKSSFPGSVPAPSSTSDEKPVEVSSIDLAAAYDANEVSAQQVYGSKSLAVTGTIKGIQLDYADHPVMLLEGKDQFRLVQAQLNGAEAAASLQKGNDVRVICQKVTEVASIPMLSDCVIGPPSPI